MRSSTCSSRTVPGSGCGEPLACPSRGLGSCFACKASSSCSRRASATQAALWVSPAWRVSLALWVSLAVMTGSLP